jgi:hypothetical protein
MKALTVNVPTQLDSADNEIYCSPARSVTAWSGEKIYVGLLLWAYLERHAKMLIVRIVMLILKRIPFKYGIDVHVAGQP